MDTVCVYADSEKSCAVALIIPLEVTLSKFKDQLSLSDITSKEELCTSEKLIDAILKSMTTMVKDKLARFEIPQQITVNI